MNMKDILRQAKNNYPMIKPHLGKNIVSILFSVLSSLLELTIPLMIKFLIDDIISVGCWEHLHIFTIGIFFIIMGRYLFSYMSAVIYARFTEGMIADARNNLFNKIMKNNLTFFYKNNDGDLHIRIMEDSSEVCTLFAYAFEQFFRNVIQIVIVFIILFSSNIILATVTAITVPVFLILNYKFGDKLKNQLDIRKKTSAMLNNFYITSLKNIKQIKNFVSEVRMGQESREINDKMRKVQVKTEEIKYTFDNLMAMTINFNRIIVLGIGGYFVAKGYFTIGALIAFYTYISYAYTPFIELSSTYKSVLESVVGLERYFEYMNDDTYTERLDKGQAIQEKINDIRVENLTFSYAPEQSPILENVNIHIRKNDKVALMGKSGNGKTTASILLKRFYDISENSIFLNNVDINKLSLESVRNRIFYLPQECMFFDGTLRYNFGIIKNDITDEEIIDALKKARIYDDFVSGNNKVLDTVISRNAAELSGGQRQRLNLAFLFVSDADVIIVDEPFTGIDKGTAEEIWDSMKEHFNDKIVIFIDHVFSDTSYFNRNVIIEDNTFKELAHS